MGWLTSGTRLALLNPPTPNPLLFLAPLNGSLAFNDRSGGGTLTGTGAVRYQAASGARTNYITNPRGGSLMGAFVPGGFGITVNRFVDTATHLFGSSARIEFSGLDATGNEYIAAFMNNAASVPSAASTYYFKVWVWTSTPNQLTFSPQFNWYDAAGTFVGTTPTTATGSTPSGVPTLTATSPQSAHVFTFSTTRLVGVSKSLVYLNIRSAGQDALAGTVWIGGALFEDIDNRNLPYFDGSTGGVWLNPLTGQLGTAHASPSVSQAAAWIEEGTTNLVTNPWFAVNTTGWSATNGTLSRVTSYAYQGPGAGNIAATGVNATFTTSITAAASAHTAQVIVRNRAAATRTVQLKYNGATIGSATTVAADETKTITAAFTGTGAAANLEVVWTDSANTENVVLYYAGAEAKAYATSPCPAIDGAGTITAGYAWTGTAHASSSTRTAVTVKTDETNRIRADRGFVALPVRPLVATAGARTLLDVGDGTAGKDRLTIRINASNQLEMAWQSNGAAATTVATAGTLAVNTWYTAYAEWDGTAVAVGLDGGAKTTGTRNAVQNDLGTANDLALGALNTGTAQADALLGPAAGGNRPLTARERARIVALPPERWSWRMLEGV